MTDKKRKSPWFRDSFVGPKGETAVAPRRKLDEFYVVHYDAAGAYHSMPLTREVADIHLKKTPGAYKVFHCYDYDKKKGKNHD